MWVDMSLASTPLYDTSGRVCAVLTALGAYGGFDSSIDGPIADAVRREARAASKLLGRARSDE
jgi:DNA-binding IclR family transcriptional regulator